MQTDQWKLSALDGMERKRTPNYSATIKQNGDTYQVGVFPRGDAFDSREAAIAAAELMLSRCEGLTQ